MSYRDHLIDLVDATVRAVPRLSDRRICIEAGLNPGWLSEYRARGSGGLDRAEQIVEVCRRVCPIDSEGDPVRALLMRYDGLSLRRGPETDGVIERLAS